MRNTLSNKWFYGWTIVAVCHLTLTVVFGVRLSFTVFFVALIDEFNWSRADTALIFSASMIVFAASSTLAGIALDKWGARRVFAIGALILALGLLLSSQIQTLSQLAWSYGGVAGLGITILGLGPQASVIARWFRQQRGLAIGVAFAGTGIGTLLFTPGTEYLISLYGWRNAYILLAAFTLATLPLILIFLRQNPADVEHRADGIVLHKALDDDRDRNWHMRNAIRTPAFWLLLIAAMGAIGPVRMLTVHQLAIMVEAGFARSDAALAVGISGAVTSVAFILLGAVSDRIDRRRIYLLGSFSLISAILILERLHFASRPTSLLVYAVLLGFGEGSRASLVTAIASDLFPENILGAVNGAVGAAFGMGAAVMPWIVGLLYDLQGNYTTGMRITVGAIMLSTLSLWLAPRFLDQK